MTAYNHRLTEMVVQFCLTNLHTGKYMFGKSNKEGGKGLSARLATVRRYPPISEARSEMTPATQVYAGKITRVFADGTSAVVRLETPVFGKQHVVIGSRTKGRIAMMNGVGRLLPETMVKGEAVDGPDAAIAVTVF